ncbi:MAG: RluA family pseudouridine synthase [Saprospiraceae bacterium]|nr:RluA family pseudouridine synthase [Saprospiraceae bacterium]
MLNLDKITLYEDNHLIILDKPSGVLSQGDYTGDPNLFDLLKDHLKVKYQKPGNVYLALVNRLDRPVSGIILFGKTSKAAARLHKMMQDGSIQKNYLAICEGHPIKEQATLEHYLIKDEAKNKTRVYEEPRKDAKKCILHYKALANIHGHCLLEVELKTGRSHQIRAQLAHISCPVVGDTKYGKMHKGVESDLALHAYALDFEHPVSKEAIHIRCLPKSGKFWYEFRAFFNKLP